MGSSPESRESGDQPTCETADLVGWTGGSIAVAESFPHVTLILGGARSGKSRYAEQRARHCAESQAADLAYLATSEIFDDEMDARIAEHRGRRGPEWRLIEEPLHLCDVLVREASESQVILVDCLTLWLSNLMHHERDVPTEVQKLTDMVDTLPGWIIFVSNEVGLSVVPDNKLARDFRDHQGRTNQDMAASADRVDFVAAGLPLTLKPQNSH